MMKIKHDNIPTSMAKLSLSVCKLTLSSEVYVCVCIHFSFNHMFLCEALVVLRDGRRRWVYLYTIQMLQLMTLLGIMIITYWNSVCGCVAVVWLCINGEGRDITSSTQYQANHFIITIEKTKFY